MSISKELIAVSKLPWFPNTMKELGYEPVRHGRWQRERNPMMYQVVPYVFVCDQCGTAFEYETPYCGECGAKMDEVRDE